MLESVWFSPAMGLLAGLVLGYVARRRHFCTLTALERHWYAGDSEGLRSWVLAAASAMVLTQLLSVAGWIEIEDSFYLAPELGLTGAIVGGLAFGFGMALVGTCGFGAAIRLGGGSLRSLVVLLVIGLAALMTQRGLLAPLRVRAVDDLALDLGAAGSHAIPDVAALWLGPAGALLLTLAIPAALFAYVYADPRFRSEPVRSLAGVTIGAVIAFGWLATSLARAHAFYPVQLEAGSFVMPVGDLLLQFVAFTGGVPDYGVGLVVGTVAGAALAAWQREDIRWEACDDARELRRHLLGALLMGAGGVAALGCTVGQGIAAASVLALSVPFVMISIAIGARLGLAFLLEGSIRHAFVRSGSTPAA